jgi:hypothetical protein
MTAEQKYYANTFLVVNLTLIYYRQNVRKCAVVNAIDPDGKDYIMTIDQENGKVTIIATYYTSTQDLASAQQAVDYWNNQSGNFTYETKEGNYTVDFSLSVVEVTTDASMSSREVTGALNGAISQDVSGAGNVYQVVDNSALGLNVNGTTVGGNYVKVKDVQKSADTGTHEVGHSLGLVHSTSGIMTPSSTDPNRSTNLRTNDVREMITNPLNGRVNSEGGNNSGRGTVRYFTPSFSTEPLYKPINKNGRVKK